MSLPGVGENLQDQPNTNIVMQGSTIFNGTISYSTFGSLYDLFSTLPTHNITAWAGVVSAAINNSLTASALTRLFQIQSELLAQGVPDAETFLETTYNLGLGPSAIAASAFWLLLPFSRGNVHISSPDANVYPDINPNFFLVDYDLEVQIAVAKWTRRFWDAEPLRGKYTELSPGLDTLPRNATDQQWADWVKSTCECCSVVISRVLKLLLTGMYSFIKLPFPRNR